MEFTKLSEVAVVETANDTDKVLIEQNGEIKRVPKTEVGGSGGGMLIIDASASTDSFVATANMTLTEAIEAFNKRELAGAHLYIPQETGIIQASLDMFGDMSAMLGAPCMIFGNSTMDLQLFWTESGFSDQPPM